MTKVSHRQKAGRGHGEEARTIGFCSISVPVKPQICLKLANIIRLPRWHSGKESGCQCRRHKRRRFHPCVAKIPWRKNGNPFQFSCLENPMDRGSWWATVHGVARSQTRLSNRAHTHKFPHRALINFTLVLKSCWVARMMMSKGWNTSKLLYSYKNGKTQCFRQNAKNRLLLVKWSCLNRWN